MRNVKGVLFSDYVRMLRHHKDSDWARYLTLEDLGYLVQEILSDQWYPMAAFERMGNAILHEIAHDDLQAVRMWGRFSADQLHLLMPDLIVKGDPMNTLRHFGALRGMIFDFDAIQMTMVLDNEAQIAIRYQMSAVAEEAASYQTMGFFERLVELSGAPSVDARFLQCSWSGDAGTQLEITWCSAL